MNEPRDDKELERYLGGDSAESRRYGELGSEQPPAEIDARVLAEAERAVKVSQLRGRRAPPFKAFAWAAVVVLSFSLVLNIVFQQAMYEPIAPVEQMAKEEAEVPRSEPALQWQLNDGAVDEKVRRDAPAVAGRVAAPEPADSYSRMQGYAETEADAAMVPDQAIGIVADFLSLSNDSRSRDSVASLAKLTKDPEAELRKILELYDDGRSDEALAALAEFRADFPDHPVSMEISERGW